MEVDSPSIYARPSTHQKGPTQRGGLAPTYRHSGHQLLQGGRPRPSDAGAGQHHLPKSRSHG